LVFYGGRPYALEEDVKKVDAFMYCWGGGEQNGIAFANLIFGDKTPSARLSVSFPKSTGSIPCYYNHKQSARGYYKKRGTPEQPGRDYVWGSSDAWMSFGYGLSYTNVEYSDLKAEVLANGDVKASVTVENKGDYDINESVLLFVRATWCPISPFEKRLRKFDKVFLKKGDKKTVEFLLTDEDFSYIDEDYKTVKHTGEHKLLVENLECSVKFE
jgi:beta-glucosidase